jgi:hypothetical protein
MKMLQEHKMEMQERKLKVAEWKCEERKKEWMSSDVEMMSLLRVRKREAERVKGKGEGDGPNGIRKLEMTKRKRRRKKRRKKRRKRKRRKGKRGRGGWRRGKGWRVME